MYQIKFVQYSKFQPGIWWNQNQNELYSYASSQSSPEILLVWKILDKLDIFFYFKILQFYGSYVSPGQNKKKCWPLICSELIVETENCSACSYQ